MKTVVSTIALLLTLMSSEVFAAQAQKSVTFEGQTGDAFELETVKVETRYRSEEVDSTCTRRIPYTVNECGYETRYRQECRWVPGHEDCRTEYDRVCRTVTRYRQECTRGRDRQECTTKPGGRVCRRVNGEMQCRDKPPQRVCRTIPGERTCRRVPYTDRECDRVPRRRCTHVPGRNVCEQVPYQEYVCRDVTRYREEQYACRRTIQVPYSFNKKVTGEVSVAYNDQTQGAKAGLNFALTPEGQIKVAAQDQSERKTLIQMNKTIEQNDNQDEMDVIGSFSFIFLDQEAELAPIKENISAVHLNKNELRFKLGKVISPERLTLAIKITRKTILGNIREVMEKTFKATELELQDLGAQTSAKVNLKALGVEIDKKKYTVKISTKVEFKKPILNPVRMETERTQEFKVKL